MAKAISGISNDTKNQLLWTEDHNIPIGAIPYWKNSLREKTPLFLNYRGNEEYWESLEQVNIKQTEFASLEIGYMFFKDPTLNKNNPYIYKDAWVPISVNEKEEVVKKPLAAFQQLWHDRISCKIIADGESIDAIKSLKYYEDCQDIVHLFDILENYDVRLNVPKAQRKTIYSAKGKQIIEITNVEDYDTDNDYERMNYRDYKYLIQSDKEWHRNYNRIEMLEKKLDIYESRIDRNFERFAKVLINAYPELKLYEALPEDMWSFGPQDLRANISKISKMYNGAGYRSIWQTWYVYQVEQMKKEIKYLEEQLL